MCAQNRLITQLVDKNQALDVITDVEIFAKWPGSAIFQNAVVGFYPLASLTLRKSLISSDHSYLIHCPSIADPRVEQGQRSERSAVMGNAGEYIGSDNVTINVYNDGCEAAQSLSDYVPLVGDLIAVAECCVRTENGVNLMGREALTRPLNQFAHR